ncbi:MAG: MarR family transcriptional regulator [Acidimicrobiales bacterium]
MPHTSEDRFLVAHSLRLKGFVAATVIAEMHGLGVDEVQAHLEVLRADGHAKLRDGRISGWSLTPSGRMAHAAACAADLSSRQPLVEAAYRRFLTLNEPFLALCGDWQLRGGPDQLNDHTDAAYDASVIARLIEVDASVQPVLVDLSAEMARFGGYAPRLAGACKRIESGERDWFTGAMIDSYHTVWFELHEDLLSTLGIERSKEGS